MASNIRINFFLNKNTILIINLEIIKIKNIKI
jgi:hypothetical protein